MLQGVSGEIKVLFDTFSFKKKYDAVDDVVDGATDAARDITGR